MVVGAGQMGRGIAQVAAQAGLSVLVCDAEEAFLDRGLSALEKQLARSVERGRMAAAELAAVMSRIEGTLDLGRAAECGFVVEAVTESLEVKMDVLRRLDAAAPAGTILASNTSSLPITQLAACTVRPDRVVGMHFMNPVPAMKLVEVIRGLLTSDETMATTLALAERLGKTPVEVRDAPGFVVNRLLMPLINEAAFCVYEGLAAPGDVDTVMRLGANHPMGPLALADLVGLDVVLAILDVLYRGFGDPKYRACPLLRQMVLAGRLGRKSGRGFFEYADSSS
ncbi:MAG: 3-hydroxybutyryl-CoA dehydrogenase [Bacillota bacterium]|nr:3-hydroxybutyryl-CoA dehydrogenase [Bacillota bacterium]